MKGISFLFAAALLCNVGCSGEKTKVEGEGGKKLTLTAPGNTSVNQGETEKITVKVAREKFDDAIDLDFDQIPEGVTLEEKDPKIEKGSSEAVFHLKADAKAPPKDGHKVKVAASGGGMKAGPLEFTLNVKEKK
jgi:hypothetical protein